MIEQEPPPDQATNRFLDLAQNGQNKWWRYLAGILAIFIVWQIIGTIFLIPLAAYVAFTNPDLLAVFDQVADIYPLFWMISVLLTFVMVWIPSWVVIRGLHSRPFKTLFTSAAGIRWSRLAQGFFVYGMLVILASLIEGLFIHPETYIWGL